MAKHASKSAEARTRPLEVLHLGMPRTGSLSMKKAYEELGMPAYHGFDFIDRQEDQIQWLKATDAKWYGSGKPFGREDFDNFLGEWAVLSDIQVDGFAEDLIQAYPEAKVVLIERDIDRWYDSYNAGIIPSIYTWKCFIMKNCIEPFRAAKPVTLTTKMMYAMFNCSDIESYRANAKKTYRDHYAKVRKLVPKDMILEYKLGSGWEPLCTFLGKEVPDKPFPYLNEGKEFGIWMSKIQTRELINGIASLAKTFILPIVLLTIAWTIIKVQR